VVREGLFQFQRAAVSAETDKFRIVPFVVLLHGFLVSNCSRNSSSSSLVVVVVVVIVVVVVVVAATAAPRRQFIRSVHVCVCMYYVCLHSAT